MATIEPVRMSEWWNYHHTLHRNYPDVRRLRAGPTPGEPAVSFFARTASAIKGLLDEVARTSTPLITLGSRWSFSSILDGPGILLESASGPAIFAVPEAARVGPADRRLVLCSGGTTIAALNAWLLEHRLSLFTSGAHNGQTVAGACGTGTHGSVLGYGGFQNHVRGIHLVTGPQRSVWVEPEPLLDEGYVAGFADEISREPDDFAAALIHLGGMGVVNALLLEVADDFRVAVIRRKTPVAADRLAMLTEGRFIDFAASIWPEASAPYPRLTPYYIEVILNPFADDSPIPPRPRPALVTLFYQRPVPLNFEKRAGPPLNDLLNLIRSDQEEVMSAPWLFPETIAAGFDQEPVGGAAPELRTWGQANGPHQAWPVDLFNAAFAIPRSSLDRAIPVMKSAFLKQGGSAAGPLVFTLRFVHRAAGLLAFTAPEDTVVVNMDGLRKPASFRSAEDVALALEIGNFAFRQHWGKQGVITPKRFVDGYGDPRDPTSRAGRWRSARERLLDRALLPLIGNDALRGWGLL